MTWSNAYIGIPHERFGRTHRGCDCWGLVRLVYDEVLGIELPAYVPTGVCDLEQAEIARLIGAAEGGTDWTRVGDPAPFDVLVFRQGRFRSHVGVAVNDRWMLHSLETGSALADITSTRWISRLDASYRHGSMA